MTTTQSILIAGLIVLLALAVVFGVRAWQRVRRDAASVLDRAETGVHEVVKLPWVTGTIVRAEVTRYQGRSPQGAIQDVFRPDFEYRYMVEDAEYTGSTETFLSASSEREHAEDIVRRHPVGRQVRIRYRPQDPRVSYLQLDDMSDTRAHPQ